MSQNRHEIKFKYIFAEDYNPVYVNGAHGGVTPRGELVINFYLERLGLPDAIIHQLNAGGALGAEIGQEPPDAKNSLVRHIDTGIILNLENAKILNGWLGERIREMESLEQAKAALSAGQTPYVTDVTH